MWWLSLEWLLVVIVVFWCTGVCKRLHRLRKAAVQAFAPFDEQCQALLTLTREQAQSHSAGAALQPYAQLLEQALQQARKHPLRAKHMLALEGAWQGVQVAWWSYLALVASPASASEPATLQQHWQQQVSLHEYCVQQFNQAVSRYTQAVEQLPTRLIARVLGFVPARTFSPDAAPTVQPTA